MHADGSFREWKGLCVVTLAQNLAPHVLPSRTREKALHSLINLLLLVAQPQKGAAEL